MWSVEREGANKEMNPAKKPPSSSWLQGDGQKKKGEQVHSAEAK